MEIALIHHPALIENDNAVCHTGNRVQIVRDKHHRDLVLALDAQQFIQDFKLGDCVNRSGRLVGDQQLGRYTVAMPIIMRCSIPPESWCGYFSSTSSGSRMRIMFSMSSERRRISAASHG